MGRVPGVKHGTDNRAWNRVTRSIALADQEGRCAYCRTRLCQSTTTADHVVPRAHRGSDRRENIVAACGACNSIKGHMSAAAFKKLVKRGEGSFAIQLAWVRRSINLATDRAVRNIERTCR